MHTCMQLIEGSYVLGVLRNANKSVYSDTHFKASVFAPEGSMILATLKVRSEAVR